jgi:predicted phosphoserine aminotransferase
MTDTFGRFFLPGPTEVHPDVLTASALPMIPHRGKGMTDLLTRCTAPLSRAFRTERRVLVGTCSATGFMEMAVRSGVRHRALSVVTGAFGERFAAIVAACGREVVRLDLPLGQSVEPDMLRDAIRRSDVDAVTLVHSETSTGALAPLPELAAVVREFGDVMLLVDAVTSAFGSPVETDAWGLDFVFTGSQKALALAPGLALGVASPRMLERAKGIAERGAYLDLVAYDEAAAEMQPTNTPAIGLLFSMDAQLKRIEQEGGIEARWRRHDAMRQVVEQWTEKNGARLGLSYLPGPGRRSWTVSCLNLPEGKVAKTVVQAAAKEGWTIGSGYGKLKESTIRIGHMGDHTPDRVTELLGVLERAVQ